MGLFNWQAEPVERTLPAALPLDERKDYHIVDFWERRYFRFKAGAVLPVLHIPPHGVALLGVRAVKPVPQLVATTFHISQGAEITVWEAGATTLTLSLKLGRLAQGKIWLSLPAHPTAAFLNDKPLPANAIHTMSAGIGSIAGRINRVAELRVEWEGCETVSQLPIFS